jgi:molybdenum cofactor cytidylyltransferase
MIAGIVLAGGQSRRMGRPKALLKVGEETFLERAVRTLSLGGCEDVVVVLNTEDPEFSEVAVSAGGRPTPGAGSGTEQIDSLRAALRALPQEVEAAVVQPVDHPLVRSLTVSALIEAFKRRGAPIVRPVYEGKHGHPVLFSAALFGELLEDDLPEGARSLVHRYRGEAEDVQVDDRGVLIDVDTPADLDEYLGARE